MSDLRLGNAALAALLVATGRTRAVFAGHTHSYEWGPVRDGITYAVIGVTGGDASNLPRSFRSRSRCWVLAP